MNKILWLFLIFGGLISTVDNLKVLGFFPSPARAHFLFARSLMRTLSDDGHATLMVSPYLSEDKYGNYSEILLENIKDFSHQIPLQGMDFFTTFFWGPTLKSIYLGHDILDYVMKGKHFRKLLTSKEQGQDFDVILVAAVQADALYGLGRHFDAPVVAVSFDGPTLLTSDLIGEPPIPMLYPNALGSDRSSFISRVVDCVTGWSDSLLIYAYHGRHQQTQLRNIFPESGWWLIDGVRYRVAMVFQNTHAALSRPRPMTPNIIEIGGIHVSKDNGTAQMKEMPKLQKFLDEATNGVIYVALGLNEVHNPHKRDDVYDSFTDYAHLRLVIVSDDKFTVPSHDPTDVMIVNWCPQEAVLAHPNVKIFVTHGGRLAIYEAVYYAKPVIALTYMYDQRINTHVIEDRKVGFRIHLTELQQWQLISAVTQLLTDSSYTERMQELSAQFRDELTTPAERAVHWVKYVAKHGGTPHLRSFAIGGHYSWLYNFDCYAYVFVVFTCILPCLYRGIVACFRSYHDLVVTIIATIRPGSDAEQQQAQERQRQQQHTGAARRAALSAVQRTRQEEEQRRLAREAGEPEANRGGRHGNNRGGRGGGRGGRGNRNHHGRR